MVSSIGNMSPCHACTYAAILAVVPVISDTLAAAAALYKSNNGGIPSEGIPPTAVLKEINVVRYLIQRNSVKAYPVLGILLKLTLTAPPAALMAAVWCKALKAEMVDVVDARWIKWDEVKLPHVVPACTIVVGE